MQTITTTATWTKLRSGEWGIKGQRLNAGEQVTVIKRNGGSQVVTVGRVVWEGSGVAIATVGTQRATTNAKACDVCGSRRNVRRVLDMSGIAGLACQRCNDGALSFC